MCVPKNKIQLVTEVFNGFNDKLEFVPEEESNGCIPFLDLLLIRNENGSISTDWYHKDTWSGRYLSFHSNLPLNYKRNTVVILTRKILELSDGQFHSKNFDLLKTTLINNKYPIEFIDSNIQKCLEKINAQNSSENDKILPSWSNICVLPYIKGLFEQIKSVWKKEEVVTVARGINTIGEHLFTRLKDKVPPQLQSNVIYEATCNCDAVYIGQTTRRLERRMYNHKYNAKQGNTEHSALCKHIVETGHAPELKDTKIIKKERVKSKRDIFEMIEIKRRPNCINKMLDSIHLSKSYYNVLIWFSLVIFDKPAIAYVLKLYHVFKYLFLFDVFT